MCSAYEFAWMLTQVITGCQISSFIIALLSWNMVSQDTTLARSVSFKGLLSFCSPTLALQAHKIMFKFYLGIQTPVYNSYPLRHLPRPSPQFFFSEGFLYTMKHTVSLFSFLRYVHVHKFLLHSLSMPLTSNPWASQVLGCCHVPSMSFLNYNKA